MKLTRATPLVLVAALALAVYLNTLPNPFLIDDGVLIVDNTLLREPGGLRKIFTTNAWASLSSDLPVNFYRPLMHLTLYIWWRLFQAHPAGYHALSMVMHAAVSVLVLLCLRSLYSAFRIPHSALPLVAALLFAVHPVHSEAVGWISAFPDVQCSLFVLLGVWFYLLERGGLADLGVGACALLALLAKEIGIVLPLLLALYELLGRRRSPAAVARDRPLAWAAVGAGLALYLGLRWYALGGLMPVPSRFSGSPEGAVWEATALLWEYAARLVLPWKLSAYHVLPVCSDWGGCLTLLDGGIFAGVAVAVLLLALAGWLYRRGRIEWLAVALFLIALAPSLPASLRENGVWLGERYLYLPSVGFCWLLAAGLTRSAEGGARKVGRFGWMAVCALLLGYAARTVARNHDWRSEIPFYLHELRTEGESPHLRAVLADRYLVRGMAREGLEQAQAAARLQPRDPRAHNVLGLAYWVSGDAERALASYRLAAQYARERGEAALAARALNNLAVAYSQMGRLELAIADYREAVRLDASFAGAHNNLGLALCQTGRAAEALPHLRIAVRLSPTDAAAHANLGLALALTGNPAAARQSFAHALSLDPTNRQALSGLASLAHRNY